MTGLTRERARPGPRRWTVAVVAAAYLAGGGVVALVYSIACARESMAAALVRTFAGATAAAVADRTASAWHADGGLGGAAVVAEGRPVAEGRLVAAFDRAVTSPITPPDPRGWSLPDDALRVALVDPRGRRVAGAAVGAFAAEAPLAAPLAGWRVAVGFDAATMDRLSYAGSTRDWTLLGAVVLTFAAGVVVVATLQLRRERETARLRSDFVASVSHELRTPLAQIRLYSELIALGWMTKPDEQRAAAGVIEQESRRLAHLVDNVLCFGRLERGSVRLALHAVDLGALCADVAAGFAPLAAASGARIDVAVAPGLHVLGDHDALRQVLINLLDNAVKHGAGTQRITLGATTVDSRRVALWVDDDGVGIPVELRERVWQPFERGAPGGAATGSGIGLAIVRQLATAMNGSTRIDAAPGGGARVSVQLAAAASTAGMSTINELTAADLPRATTPHRDARRAAAPSAAC